MEVQSDLPLLRDSIKSALDAGLIVVAAAGNNNGGSTVYPAAYEGMILMGMALFQQKKSEVLF